ncbi:serine protease inhibitor 5-like [Solanum dulcamara]|uniref:serine protease inhibitor 5-like n=1 Tax=Solanum dulcamara TaxID=45834 RepID=UPI0024865966|nr:serine protease inhibitor 5-like [Solanum dulcamara]
MRCLFFLCFCLLPIVVFSSTFTSQNPIDLPSAKPVPLLDVTGKEVDPRLSYRMVPTYRGPSGGDIYLDYSLDSTAPCPDGVFRYNSDGGPKGTPVRFIAAIPFGPYIYEEQDINIQFDISTVKSCVDYTIWKVGGYDVPLRVELLKTGGTIGQQISCFKIVKSPRLLGYSLLTCSGSLVGTINQNGKTPLALVANYSLDFNFQKVEE